LPHTFGKTTSSMGLLRDSSRDFGDFLPTAQVYERDARRSLRTAHLGVAVERSRSGVDVACRPVVGSPGPGVNPDNSFLELVAEATALLETLDGCREAIDAAYLYLWWINSGSLEPPDQAMLERISDLLDSGEDLTEPDRVFLIHEYVEEALLRKYQEAPHDALRDYFGSFANYAPAVVKAHPEYFNSSWREHWGL
jgi:hypothetical protein